MDTSLAQARTPKLAINAHGQALLTYELNYSDVYARFRSASGVWSSPRRLTRRNSDREDWWMNPQPALNVAGDAWVAWSNQKRHGPVRTVVISSFDRLTHRWLEAPVLLNAPGVTADDPVLRLNEQGQMLVSWEQGGLFHTRAQTRLYTPTQGWAPVTDLSRAGRSYRPPGIALDEAGNATTVWAQFTSDQSGHLHMLAQPLGAPAVDGRLHAHDTLEDSLAPWRMAESEGQHAIVVFVRRVPGSRKELVGQVGHLGDCPP